MGKSLKIDGWQERLGITFIYYRSQPFLWGKTDCWCFVSDCVKTQTGINPMKIVNGLYDTEEKGYKLLEGAVGNDGVYRKFLDSSRINNLGFKNLTSLKDGLIKSYQEYTKN